MAALVWAIPEFSLKVSPLVFYVNQVLGFFLPREVGQWELSMRKTASRSMADLAFRRNNLR